MFVENGKILKLISGFYAHTYEYYSNLPKKKNIIKVHLFERQFFV